MDESKLPGCYLLIILGQPLHDDHKGKIIQRVAKGLLSWDTGVTQCDLTQIRDAFSNLPILSNPSRWSPMTSCLEDGSEEVSTDVILQQSTDKLAVEILLNPQLFTLRQCIKNLLLAPTGHKHVIHAGYNFSGSGSWILQDATFSLQDLIDLFFDPEIVSFSKSLGTPSLHVHATSHGEWTESEFEERFSGFEVKLNPPSSELGRVDGSADLVDFLDRVLTGVSPTQEMERTSIVGNIRFNHPTLYLFPGGQGDSCLFGVNGFTMLIDGGFSPLPCFWTFVRHLERLDAILITRTNEHNLWGLTTFLKKKVLESIYPTIGCVICNLSSEDNIENTNENGRNPSKKIKKSESDHGDTNGLVVSLLQTSQEFLSHLKTVECHGWLDPRRSLRDASSVSSSSASTSALQPITLYHKVGHGTLDLYILSPMENGDTKHLKGIIKDSFIKTSSASGKRVEVTIPLTNFLSSCCLLVWRPSSPNEPIVRILFPGSAPQKQIFEGLDKLKSLEFFREAKCTRESILRHKRETKASRIRSASPSTHSRMTSSVLSRKTPSVERKSPTTPTTLRSSSVTPTSRPTMKKASPATTPTGGGGGGGGGGGVQSKKVSTAKKVPARSVSLEKKADVSMRTGAPTDKTGQEKKAVVRRRLPSSSSAALVVEKRQVDQGGKDFADESDKKDSTSHGEDGGRITLEQAEKVIDDGHLKETFTDQEEEKKEEKEEEKRMLETVQTEEESPVELDKRRELGHSNETELEEKEENEILTTAEENFIQSSSSFSGGKADIQIDTVEETTYEKDQVIEAVSKGYNDEQEMQLSSEMGDDASKDNNDMKMIVSQNEDTNHKILDAHNELSEKSESAESRREVTDEIEQKSTDEIRKQSIETTNKIHPSSEEILDKKEARDEMTHDDDSFQVTPDGRNAIQEEEIRRTSHSSDDRIFIKDDEIEVTDREAVKNDQADDTSPTKGADVDKDERSLPTLHSHDIVCPFTPEDAEEGNVDGGESKQEGEKERRKRSVTEPEGETKEEKISDMKHEEVIQQDKIERKKPEQKKQETQQSARHDTVRRSSQQGTSRMSQEKQTSQMGKGPKDTERKSSVTRTSFSSSKSGTPSSSRPESRKTSLSEQRRASEASESLTPGKTTPAGSRKSSLHEGRKVSLTYSTSSPRPSISSQTKEAKKEPSLVRKTSVGDSGSKRQETQISKEETVSDIDKSCSETKRKGSTTTPANVEVKDNAAKRETPTDRLDDNISDEYKRASTENETARGDDGNATENSSNIPDLAGENGTEKVLTEIDIQVVDPTTDVSDKEKEPISKEKIQSKQTEQASVVATEELEIEPSDVDEARKHSFLEEEGDNEETASIGDSSHEFTTKREIGDEGDVEDLTSPETKELYDKVVQEVEYFIEKSGSEDLVKSISTDKLQTRKEDKNNNQETDLVEDNETKIAETSSNVEESTHTKVSGVISDSLLQQVLHEEVEESSASSLESQECLDSQTAVQRSENEDIFDETETQTTTTSTQSTPLSKQRKDSKDEGKLTERKISTGSTSSFITELTATFTLPSSGPPSASSSPLYSRRSLAGKTVDQAETASRKGSLSLSKFSLPQSPQKCLSKGNSRKQSQTSLHEEDKSENILFILAKTQATYPLWEHKSDQSEIEQEITLQNTTIDLGNETKKSESDFKIEEESEMYSSENLATESQKNIADNKCIDKLATDAEIESREVMETSEKGDRPSEQGQQEISQVEKRTESLTTEKTNETLEGDVKQPFRTSLLSTTGEDVKSHHEQEKQEKSERAEQKEDTKSPTNASRQNKEDQEQESFSVCHESRITHGEQLQESPNISRQKEEEREEQMETHEHPVIYETRVDSNQLTLSDSNQQTSEKEKEPPKREEEEERTDVLKTSSQVTLSLDSASDIKQDQHDSHPSESGNLTKEETVVTSGENRKSSIIQAGDSSDKRPSITEENTLSCQEVAAPLEMSKDMDLKCTDSGNASFTEDNVEKKEPGAQVGHAPQQKSITQDDDTQESSRHESPQKLQNAKEDSSDSKHVPQQPDENKNEESEATKTTEKQVEEQHEKTKAIEEKIDDGYALVKATINTLHEKNSSLQEAEDVLTTQKTMKLDDKSEENISKTDESLTKETQDVGSVSSSRKSSVQSTSIADSSSFIREELRGNEDTKGERRRSSKLDVGVILQVKDLTSEIINDANASSDVTEPAAGSQVSVSGGDSSSSTSQESGKVDAPGSHVLVVDVNEIPEIDPKSVKEFIEEKVITEAIIMVQEHEEPGGQSGDKSNGENGTIPRREDVRENTIITTMSVSPVTASVTGSMSTFTSTTQSIANSSIEHDTTTTTDTIIKEWGKPLGLPIPPIGSSPTPTEGAKGRSTSTTRPTARVGYRTAGSSSGNVVYVDLAYIPHHGDGHYCNSSFFKRVRARHYVLSSVNPCREVLDALIEGKKTWEDKDAQVTLIPTHESETLLYWMSTNQEVLEANKIDIAPSANRCTVTLQNHDTSCAAYRIEF